MPSGLGHSLHHTLLRGNALFSSTLLESSKKQKLTIETDSWVNYALQDNMFLCTKAT
jgi:hypothetical protein